MKLTQLEKKYISENAGNVWHEGNLLMKVDTIQLEDNENLGVCRIADVFTNDTIDEQYFIKMFQSSIAPRLDIFIYISESKLNKKIQLTNVTFVGEIPDIKKNEYFNFTYLLE